MPHDGVEGQKAGAASRDHESSVAPIQLIKAYRGTGIDPIDGAHLLLQGRKRSPPVGPIRIGYPLQLRVAKERLIIDNDYSRRGDHLV